MGHILHEHWYEIWQTPKNKDTGIREATFNIIIYKTIVLMHPNSLKGIISCDSHW